MLLPDSRDQEKNFIPATLPLTPPGSLALAARIASNRYSARRSGSALLALLGYRMNVLGELSLVALLDEVIQMR